jgi:hypothetical protein
LLSARVSDPAEWGRRFQELATDAGQMYARVLRRYNELLTRVAAGELKPDHVQAQFRDYLQEQAMSSTREIVELSVGLLAGLLHIEGKYREALLEGLLPPDGPLPPPPSPSSLDLTNWFQTLSKYATEQSARGMTRHQQLVERVAAGEITPAAMEEQGRRFLQSESPRFLGEVMDLGLTFVARLQRSSTSFAEGLYDRILGADESSAPEPPLVLELRGRTGSIVTAALVVENSRSEAASVVCRVSEFASRTREQSFISGATATPTRFTLAPGESREVRLNLPLDRTMFTPGHDYFAILLISGAADREIVVHLIAHAEVAPEPPPEPSPVPPPPVRKKKAKSP